MLAFYKNKIDMALPSRKKLGIVNVVVVVVAIVLLILVLVVAVVGK